MHDIAVLGAGITGVTTAHALMDKGFAVTLYDRRNGAGEDTSFANGGQLSASNAEVWTHPATLLKAIGWMLRADAPLLFNPTPSWAKYTWMLEFLANVPHYRANTVKTARMAIAAREILLEMAAREGVPFDLERRGILHIYRSEAGLRHARQVSGMLAEAGLTRREVTGEDIRGIEPALPRGLAGGFFTETDMSGDIHRFTTGLAAALARKGALCRYGVEIARAEATRTGVALTSAAGERWQHDAVVVAAGVGSRSLGQQLGDRVPVYPVKGYSITVPLDSPAQQAAAPWVSLLDDETKLVSSRLGAGRLRVAGTAEFNGWNREIRQDRIAPLTRWVETLFPGALNPAHPAEPWAGLRPMTPSMMPRVGRGRRPGVFYNTGHGHLGWTLSAFTARLVADTVAASAGNRGLAALPIAAE